MASYETRLDSATGITYVTVLGTILIADFKEFLNSDAFHQRANKVLWDITGATVSDVLLDEFIRSLREVESMSRRNVKAAFVYQGDADHDKGPMFKIYAVLNQLPARVAIFSNDNEALDWLNAESKKIE